jgi:hypothetical protein
VLGECAFEGTHPGWLLWAFGFRRTTSATRYGTWTHPPSSLDLARVDQPKPGHAFPCVTVAGGAGSERCAHSRTVKALRPTRPEDVSPPFREETCTPTEGTESEEPRVAAFLRTSYRSRAPARRVSSTPLSSMRAPGPWRDPPLRTNRGSASSALSAKSGRLLVNRGAFHRQDRSRDEDRSSCLRTAGLLLTGHCLSARLTALRHAGAPAPLLPFPEKPAGESRLFLTPRGVRRRP